MTASYRRGESAIVAPLPEGGLKRAGSGTVKNTLAARVSLRWRGREEMPVVLTVAAPTRRAACRPASAAWPLRAAALKLSFTATTPFSLVRTPPAPAPGPMAALASASAAGALPAAGDGSSLAAIVL